VGANGLGAPGRAFAQQRLTEAELLRFEPLGNITLLHVADVHGQLVPVHFREPSVNIGVGEAKGLPPHVTGKDFLKRFGIADKSAAAYALSDQDFVALAQSYGRIGGLDRLAGLAWELAHQGPGHGRLLQAAQPGRHDRTLGVHLR
jgi:sulfur-oxidizing protein SoxB